MILTTDISQELDLPLKQVFVDTGVLDKETERCIKNNFQNHKTRYSRWVILPSYF